MSASTELSDWQKFHSHVASCKAGCKKVENRTVLCVVGALYLARAKKEPETSQRPKSFPFVAKLYERVLAKIGGIMTECVVMDRSIHASHMYEKTDFKTGTTVWRTAAPTIVGYEVEVDDSTHHYVRPENIKSMRKQPLPPREAFVPSLNKRDSKELADLILPKRNG